MRRTVCIETTIFSYLASRPSRDLIVAARQQLTHLWWQSRRSDFDLYVSGLVLDEIEAGDPEQAQKRSVLVAGIPVLDIPPEVADLAAALIKEVPFPPKAGTDAAPIAVAAYHGVNFLLTWNAAHIANAELRPRVE